MCLFTNTVLLAMKHYKMIYVQTSKHETYNSLVCSPKRVRRSESVLTSQIQSWSRCKIGCNSSFFSRKLNYDSCVIIIEYCFIVSSVWLQ